jgi:hypothetical protein
MLFTEWTYQIYVEYQKDPSNLCCLWKGPIKLMLCLRNGPIALMLFTEGTHQQLGLMGPLGKQNKLDGSIP